MNFLELKNEIFKSGLIDYFSIIEDPRADGRHTLYKLIDILIIALCGVICGANHWTEIAEYGRKKEAWLRQFLELSNGIPSHDTFSRVFRIIDPVELKKAFDTWVDGYLKNCTDCIISIDGKTSRGSQDRKNGNKPIHLLNVWLHDAGIVLGQLRVSEKTNEITKIPTILEMITVKGNTITIDAIGCQKNITDKIIKKKGDYVIALKGNQGTLEDDVKLFFQDYVKKTYKSLDERIWDYFESTEKGHGRIEKRRCWHTTDVEWLKDQNHKWSGLNSLCAIESTRIIDGEKSKEFRFYISSYSKPNAKRISNTIRAHWGIENELHYVLDVSMGEDDSRVRKDHGPENFSLLRKIALNLCKSHRSTDKCSIRAKRKMAGWDDDLLAEIIFGIQFISFRK